jgi:hypothetical protein
VSVVPELTELELDLKRFVELSSVPQAVVVIETVAPVRGVQESLAVLQRGELAFARGEATGRNRTEANATMKVVRR